MYETTSTRQQSCTVTVEQNRYGAMTLRSTAGRTYQIVGSKHSAIEEDLARLAAGSEVTVKLTRAHGRGDGWYVVAVDAAEPVRPPADAPPAVTDQLRSSNQRSQ